MARPPPNDLGGPTGPEPASASHLPKPCTASCAAAGAAASGGGSRASGGREGAGRVLGPRARLKMLSMFRASRRGLQVGR